MCSSDLGAGTVESWGGRAEARVSKGNRIQMGDFGRDNLSIWEDKNSGKETDGKFGLDFFQNRIVEIDFDRSLLSLHERLPRKVETYERLRMEDRDGQLFIEGNCLIDGSVYPNKFLLHSGYAGGVLIDDEYAVRAGVEGKIRIVEESVLKDSFGNSIKVRKGVLPE